MVQQATETKSDPAKEASGARRAFVGARRQEILDAARRAFIARGFHATSMQQIAAESGVSAGNIYRYFPNKEALIGAVCEGCVQEMQVSFAVTSAESGSPNMALGALGDQVWGSIGTEESRDQVLLNFEALLVAARNPAVGEISRQSAQFVADSLTAMVTGAQAAGEIDEGLDAKGLATLLYALVLGMQQLHLQLGDDADPATVWATQQKLLAPFERQLGPATATE